MRCSSGRLYSPSDVLSADLAIAAKKKKTEERTA